MLIYQLDAWIFNNKLNYWCSQNFDYIGAPWFHENESGKIVFDGIGNGGLSLRKIETHIKVLKSFSLIDRPGYFLYLLGKEKTLQGLISILKKIIFGNNTNYLFNRYNENEDKFWGLIAARNFKWFRLPSLEVAKKFSVETFPALLIEEGQLPFGCHAWERYDTKFWQKYIDL